MNGEKLKFKKLKIGFLETLSPIDMARFSALSSDENATIGSTDTLTEGEG
jgi:hypothetical protein